MPAPILLTKLTKPPLRANIVSRSRLLKRLDTGLIRGGEFNRKLSLVAAPAGYGKTTLVSDWVDHTGLPVCWISLDESDNDPRRFFTYLIAALQQVEGGIGAGISSALEAQQAPPDDVFLTMLANEITLYGEPVVLVLDDYHVVQSMAIHQQLAFLLDHQPANLHLVITTREDPMLPIARLRGRGYLLEISQADLRFTSDEIVDFLENVMGLALLPEEILALEQSTEGWIAGLQLAALSMQDRDDLKGFIQSFTGSNRFILDYLMEEVFERQTLEVKGFLLKTSVLERLSGTLCDAVTGQIDSQEILEMLEQANLFIVPLDQSREWYRYHRLFAELLRHRLRLSEINEKELHQRASEWFEQNGLYNEAIHHAVNANNWDQVGRLIQIANTEFLKRGEVLTVIGWFRSIPEEVLLANPRLCFDYCWPLLLTTQYDAAAPLLDHVERLAGDMPEFLGEVHAAQAYLARGQGDHERMVERSQSAMRLLPQDAINSRGIVAVNLGLAYWHMGRMRDTEEVLNEALEIGRATSNHYAALTAMIFLGRVLAVRGQLHQAAKYFEDAIQYGNEIPINALAYMDLATLNYEWNLLDVSENHLQMGISLCERSKNYEFLVGARMFQSRLQIARGNLADAEAALKQAWALVDAGTIPASTAARVNASQTRLLLAKHEPIGEWKEKLTETIDCHPFYRFLGVTKARTMVGPQAIGYLKGLGKVALANEWIYGLIATRSLLAGLTESPVEALGHLEEALKYGQDGGFIRSFVEAGEQLIPVLKQAAQQGIASEYVGWILALMLEEVSEGSESPLFEPLSRRELEVLRLISSGMSNREIAKSLVISTGTAKTHVHNICGKLGVSNRTQAAIKAKELKLI